MSALWILRSSLGALLPCFNFESSTCVVAFGLGLASLPCSLFQSLCGFCFVVYWLDVIAFWFGAFVVFVGCCLVSLGFMFVSPWDRRSGACGKVLGWS